MLFIVILLIAFPGETAHAFTFVPKFISHYNHHNEHHHRLSFVEFIGEHFTKEHHDLSQKHKDDDCPINHDHSIVSLTFINEKSHFADIIYENKPYSIKKVLFPPYQSFFSEFHSFIWQPPKLN